MKISQTVGLNLCGVSHKHLDLPCCPQALCNQNNFGAAADIFVKGKNNARNATAEVFRIMHDFTFRNLSEGDASWWGIYTKHFNSMQYLKDLIE